MYLPYQKAQSGNADTVMIADLFLPLECLFLMQILQPTSKQNEEREILTLFFLFSVLHIMINASITIITTTLSFTFVLEKVSA